jgi:hypothetical protein
MQPRPRLSSMFADNLRKLVPSTIIIQSSNAIFLFSKLRNQIPRKLTNSFHLRNLHVAGPRFRFNSADNGMFTAHAIHDWFEPTFISTNDISVEYGQNRGVLTLPTDVTKPCCHLDRRKYYTRRRSYYRCIKMRSVGFSCNFFPLCFNIA